VQQGVGAKYMADLYLWILLYL